MADNFSNKGYEDYFKALERQLNKSGAPEVKKVAEPEVKPEEKPAEKPADKNPQNGDNAAIPFVLIATMLSAAAVMVIFKKKIKA